MKCDEIISFPTSRRCMAFACRNTRKPGMILHGEDRVPVPNDGKILDEPKKYSSMFTAVDGESMKVAWQIMVDGNLGNVDADYQGKYAWSTCYNSEKGVALAEMMAKEQDWVVVFNLKRIEEDVKAGKHEDHRRRAGPQRSPWLALHRYIPVGNSPHGINTAPDGIHFVANGKLSPTVTVFDARKLDDLFDDKSMRDTVVAEPGSVSGRCTLRQQGQRLHDALPRQPSVQMEHRFGDAPSKARRSSGDPEARRALSARSQPHPWGRPRRPTGSGSCR